MILSHSTLFGGALMLDSTVEKGAYAPHWHDDYVFAVYRGGAKKFRCSRYTGDAAAGDVLVIAPGTIHSAVSFDEIGWDYRSLYLSQDQISKATGLSGPELDIRFGDFTHASGRIDLACSFFEICDAQLEMALAEWLLAIPNNNQKTSTKIPERIADVYERIMDDPSRSIRLQDLAKIADVTPEHLCRAFRRAYGLSPFQLLIAARIQLAFKSIRAGKKLCEAASLAGFADQSHMSRWIKRTYGVTPGNL